MGKVFIPYRIAFHLRAMSARKAIWYNVNLASEFQPPPRVTNCRERRRFFPEYATRTFHAYIELRKKLTHFSLRTFLNI